MIGHILVPLDGSQLAEAALPAAVFFARCFGAKVSLAHFIEKRRPRTVHEQQHLHDDRTAAAYLAKTAAAFPDGTIVDCHVHGQEVSDVAKSIVAHCVSELQADLVIMCTHGDDGTRRFAPGSISQQVIALGTTPVLVVRARGDSPATFACDRMLVPLGGQPDHGDIIASVEPFVRCCRAIIRLISVVPTTDTIPGKWFQVGRLLPGATAEMLDIESEETAKFLETQASTLRAPNLTVETRVLRGDPGHCIAIDAQESGSALIVMATHGRSGMAALWDGSVAPKVFAESRTPILLLPVGK